MKLFEFVTWMFTEDEDESREHIEKGAVQVEGEVIQDPLYEIKPQDFVRFWDQGCRWTGETPEGPLPRKEKYQEKLDRMKEEAEKLREHISKMGGEGDLVSINKDSLLSLLTLINELAMVIDGYKIITQALKEEILTTESAINDLREEIRRK